MDDLIATLHAASRWFESFADRHQHGIAALGAFGTVAAVIVALWTSQQARRATRPKLKARVTVMQIFYAGIDLEAIPTYVALQLTNIGSVPIRFHSTCFSWRLPYRRSAWMAQPVDERGDQHVDVHPYPFTLHPNTSNTMLLTEIGIFDAEAMPRIIRQGKLPRWLVVRWLRAVVYTDDGSLFRARLDSTIREHIRKADGAPEPAKKPD